MSMPIPDGSVIITPTQMYTEIQAANAKIDHLTAILDPAIVNMRQDIAENKAAAETALTTLRADVEKKLDDHEGRLRALDANRWKHTGLVGAISALLSSGIAVWIVDTIATRH